MKTLKNKFGKKGVEILMSKMTKKQLAESTVLLLKILYNKGLVIDKVVNEKNRRSRK